MKPVIDIQVNIDIPKTTEDTSFINGVYTVIFTLLNQGPTAAQIYDKNNNLVTTLTNQGDSDNPVTLIELPELPYYTAKFIGSDDIATISVSVDAFASVIKNIVLSNSLGNYTKPDIVPTLFGYPAFELSYQGINLAEYLEAFNIENENNLVPFSIPGILDPAIVVSFADYKIRANVPFFIKPRNDISMSYNGLDYNMQEGQMLLVRYVGDIEVFMSSIFIHMKADDNLTSGLSINIHSDISGSPGTLLSTGTIAKIDLTQTLALTEIKLEEEIFVKNFWVQIVPLNSYSTHTIGLSDQSDVTETRFSRYVNGEDFGADSGKTYGEVAEESLDAIYGSSISYPILVTDMEELTALNKIYRDSLQLEGFNGPCFVVFEEGIQVGDNFVPYGLDQNRAITDIVSAINNIPNYETKLIADSSVSAGNLFSLYRVPELTVNTPVEDIELFYSQFIAPDNTNRKIIVRMKAISVSYDTKNRIELLTPLIAATGEWRPRILPGFLDTIAIEIGDSIYDANTTTFKTVTDVTDINVELNSVDNNLYSKIFEVIEPTNFPVLKHNQVPVQLSEKAFQVDRRPLYLEGGVPLFAFNTGEDLETPLVTRLEDFDDKNGILVFPMSLRYNINKFVSYYYIEENYIEPTIDIKVAVSSSVNIYLSANPATPLLALDSEELIVAYNNEICVLLGSYRITGDTAPEDITIVDSRTRGGGIVKDFSYDSAFEKNPAVTGFYDIGYNTGKRIPQAVLTLALPSTIRDVFTDEQIHDIAHKHVTAGTKVYIEYNNVFEEDPSLTPSSSSGESSSSS